MHHSCLFFFDYTLPERLIASSTPPPAAMSLDYLSYDGRRVNSKHRIFRDLPELLAPTSICSFSMTRK